MTYKTGKNYQNTPETKMSQKLPIKLENYETTLEMFITIA